MSKRSKKKKRNALETIPVVEPMREMAGVLDSKPPGANGKLILLRAMLIVLAGLWVFWPALRGDWLWDDDRLITDNYQLRTWSGLWNIWFVPGSQWDYYPVEQTVLWLEWRLWHNETLGYHVITLVLHLLSALLVWRLLGKMGLRLAWLGGLLFAIHPVQVESAAWAAELKNTLSLPPLLLAMSFYLDYEERKKPRDYLLALALFGVALLCKLTVVMFPVVILLYAWWKRGRIGWSDLKTSAPFFVLSLAVGLVTILGGVWGRIFNHLAPGDMPAGGLAARLVLAGQELAFYFSKSILPIELLPVYPKWAIDPASPLHYLPWLVLGGVVWWLWTKRESWGRHALLGLGFFLINLMPCPGFIPAPNMGYAWTMDHFLYLPIIGLIGLVVAALGQMEERLAPTLRPVGVGMMAVVMALLAWESHSYAGLYINPETLWTYTLARNPEAWAAHNGLGVVLQRTGRIPEAIEQFEQALKLKPDYAEAHNNLGAALLQVGRVDEAMVQCQEALQLKPDYAEIYNNLGSAFLQKGQVDEAIVQCQKALEINPNDAAAHYSLGTLLLQTGRVAEAIGQFEQTLQLNPDLVEVHNSMGNALRQSGRVSEAMDQYEQALRLQPDDAEAHNNLGVVLLQSGRVPEAMDQCEQASRLKPDYAEAHYNLGNALLQAGRRAEAIAQYQEAVRLNPDYAEAYGNLGVALQQTGRISEAITQYEKELKLKPDDVGAHYNLGVALEQSGRVAEAIKQYQEVLQLNPDNAAAQSKLAKAQAMARQRAGQN
jgi:tetratricopeptide (TPR) repeat protein